MSIKDQTFILPYIRLFGSPVISFLAASCFQDFIIQFIKVIIVLVRAYVLFCLNHVRKVCMDWKSYTFTTKLTNILIVMHNNNIQ